MHEILRSLRIPGFARLVAAYWLNELTDWLATIALSVLVWDQTHDPLATTALFVASKFLPGFLVPLLAARIDGMPIARLLASAYTVEAVCLGVLAATASAFFLPLVLVLALVSGTLAAVARTSIRTANVAVLEAQGRLREGNALLNMGYSAMNAAGPMAAGALVGLIGAGAVLAIGAAAFLVQAVVAGTAPGLPRGEAESGPWGERLREGFAYVRSDKRLTTLLGSQAVVFLLLTMITPIEVVYAKETLEAGDAGFGLLLATWGVGMVLGSWIFARERQRPLLLLITLSTFAMSLGYLGMAAAPTLAVACAASMLGGMGNGVQWVAVVTAMQEATEARFQARVAGLLEAVITVAPGAGFLLGGLLTAVVNPRAAFAASGGGVLLVLFVAGLVLGVGRLRGRSAAPAPASVEPAPEPAG